MATNYYQILGVDRNASEDQIKKAYRILAMKYHPDRNPGNQAAANKMAEINKANEVLSDPKKRKFYDQHGYYKYNEGEVRETCDKCGIDITGKQDFKHPKITGKFFCSLDHANEYYNERFGKKENKPCQSCESLHPNGVPEKCDLIINGLNELQYLEERENYYSYLNPSEENDFEVEIKSTNFYYDLDEVKNQIRKIINRAKTLNKQKKNSIDQERNNFLQQLKNLDGWNLLSEKRQNEIIEEMKRNRATDQFRDVLEMTKKEIAKLRGNDRNDRNLATEIQKAISEIEAELNKEPKITLANDNWRTYITNSANLDELNSRKQEILAKIRDIRQSQPNQNLNNLRQQAINQIRAELSQSPMIDESQLANPNWETEINQAKTENVVNEIRDRVLADIRNKRAVVAEKNRLNELLTQTRQEENWNNYQNLANILQEIKKMRSSNGYEEKKSEIQAIEDKLRELDPKQFKKTNADSLNQQVKDNGLTADNMDEETKQALAEAQADPTPEKIAKAEEKIAQNGANNNLNNLITQTEKKLKQGNLTKKEIENLITEILQFIAKNNYQERAYQKQKSRVDKLLAELREGKSQDNTQNPPFWKKALVPLLVISLLGIMITGILIWRKKQLRRKVGWE